MVKKIIVNEIDHRFAIQRNLASLNSPVVCFTSDILNLFSKEDQVCNYIYSLVYIRDLSEAVSK